MKADRFIVRAMSRSEIDLAVEWAAREGWNPGLHDADAFHAADAGAFLVGELDGEAVATISVVQYGTGFGFLGFYIVKPAWRGKGFGLRVWNAGMERLTGRNIGLDGVVAQQDNYRKSGFRLAYRNVRYEGRTGGKPSARPEIVDLDGLALEQVLSYDKPFFPDDRTAFLKTWLKQPGRVALGVKKAGHLAGYGMVRACRTGYKIGPLFADSPELAENLFHEMIARVEPGQRVYLDTPEVNREAVALAERHGMQVVFETARMYTGPFPDLPLDRLFGVTTFELG